MLVGRIIIGSIVVYHLIVLIFFFLPALVELTFYKDRNGVDDLWNFFEEVYVQDLADFIEFSGR